MSDQQSNFELDDELLSAYLDGELSATERAAVEARLAGDSAAQQLLHELRSVSQDVQSLPLERIGRDLSHDVLERIESAKPAPALSGPAHSGDALPKITVFGSKRAWFWASLALAAGLLIMFVQPVDKRSEKLPPVAGLSERELANAPANEPQTRFDRAPTGGAAASKSELASQLTDDFNNRPNVELGTPSAAPMPSQPLGELSQNGSQASPDASTVAGAGPGQKLDNLKRYSESESKRATSFGAQKSVDKLAAPQPARRASDIEGQAGDYRNKSELPSAAFAPGESAATGTSSTEPGKELLVVRVMATRDALQKKSFDELLARQKITVEPPPANEKAEEASVRAFAKPSATPSSGLATKPADNEEAELVLVEASQPAITSCLDGLHKDSANFPGIQVDEISNARDGVEMKLKLSPTKKLADDLSKYTRGVVQRPLKDATRNEHFYYDFYVADKADELAAEGGPGLAGGRSAPSQEGRAGTSYRRAGEAESLGRARRIQSWHVDAREIDDLVADGARSGPGGAPATDAKKSPASSRRLKELTKPAADQIQVLFVLRPENAAAPSAPTVDRAE